MGQVETCKFLLKSLVNKNCVDNIGLTPLHLAAQEGRLEVCKILVENQAEKEFRDNDGYTPLHLGKLIGIEGTKILEGRLV